MNINKNELQYVITMLVTLNGFMVKVKKVINGKNSFITCFFVDRNFNHMPWKLTITKGIKLNMLEYNRLKGVVKLAEISPVEKQIGPAIELAEKLTLDPYLGLEEGVKALYLNAELVNEKQPVPNVPTPVEKTAHPATAKKAVSKPAAPAAKAIPAPSLHEAKKKAQPLLGIKGFGFEVLQKLHSA